MSEAAAPGPVAEAVPAGAAYLAAEGFEAECEAALIEAGGRLGARHGRLLLSPDPPRANPWAANIWLAPQEIAIASIKDAAAKLKAIQRNWALFATGLHRRAALIEAALPPVKARPLRFPEPAPTAPLGGWTLLAPDRLLASARCSSAFPNGVVRFEEDRTGPPSRAYLKLWEALTLIGAHPAPGSLCLDLGAAPGGWSHALARLGARVVAVDKAALDPKVTAMPGLRHLQQSAFALDPAAFRAEEGQPADWLFSDVVCYPARLLALVRRWLAAGAARRFVCTIKFQGATDHEVVRDFAALPGARLMHLHHNKHELTFVLV